MLQAAPYPAGRTGEFTRNIIDLIRGILAIKNKFSASSVENTDIILQNTLFESVFILNRLIYTPSYNRITTYLAKKLHILLHIYFLHIYFLIDPLLF